MPKFDDHPTVRAVRAVRARSALPVAVAPKPLLADDLRRLCLDAGADDAGFVAIGRAELDDQRADILRYFPATKALISIVCRMNPASTQSPARNISNLEFHEATDSVNAASRLIAAKLSLLGIRALTPPAGFPMDMQNFPGKLWIVSHKPVAVAAGLGRMGIHRNVIHPKFGSFVILGTLLIDTDIDTQSTPIDYNPCLECRLCIAACPVGAIADDGFNFASCYTHNYREFMGGFTDWAESIADAGSAKAYREGVTDSESASMWQSLAYGPNYKAAYCLAVCPAGEEIIPPFLQDRPAFVKNVVKPLQEKSETIYVLPGADAEAHVAKRFPHKTIKRVGSVLRPTSIRGFIRGMQHVFQPGQAKDLDATYHFRFTGAEAADCTVTIKDQRIEVRDGHAGAPNLRVTADARTWLRFLRHDAGLLWPLLTRRIKIRGDPRLLLAFGKCFPK